jgi:adenylate kinase
MRIFLNNVDSYVGKALCADLRQVVEKENRIIGTMSSDDNQVDMETLETMGVKRIVSRRDRREYLKDILSCSLIVFDLHSASLEDVEYVIKQLKIAKLERNVVFVLISSVNVWAKTKNERVPENADDEEEQQDEDPDAPPKIVKTKPAELKDSDLDRRTPETASVYEKWKYLENMAMALKSKDKLRPHVVCAGILYGNGETTFNDPFKEAWLTRATHSIIMPGDNYIPCVHVRDVARLVRVVAMDDSVSAYLIAVDKARLTQAMIVQGIVDNMSNKVEVPVRHADEVSSEFKDVMMIDLIMQPSAPMRKKEFAWWCREGLVANMNVVATEFCKWRNLRPIKMAIIGPPGSGGESFSKLVAERYLHEDPPLLSFQSILQEALEEKAASGKPKKAALLLRRKVDKAAKKTGGKLPLAVRTELVRKKLLSNVCRFRGYVLEGYPQSAEEAEALFTELEPNEDDPPVEEEPEDDGEDLPEEEEGEEEEEEAPAAAEEEDEDDETRRKRILSTAIVPEFVVELSSEVERCKERIFSGQAKGASGEEEFVRLMKEYRANNLSEDGSIGTGDFFEETAGVKVLHADVDRNDEIEIFHAIRVYMESRGQFFNYLKSEEDRMRDVAADRVLVEQREDAQREREVADIKSKEAFRQQVRGKEEDARLRLLADTEKKLLENEALPLRQYLQINVHPTLTDGLMEVCKVMPEDPIEYLAEYLFAHAHKIEAQLGGQDQ